MERTQRLGTHFVWEDIGAFYGGRKWKSPSFKLQATLPQALRGWVPTDCDGAALSKLGGSSELAVGGHWEATVDGEDALFFGQKGGDLRRQVGGDVGGS